MASLTDLAVAGIVGGQLTVGLVDGPKPATGAGRETPEWTVNGDGTATATVTFRLTSNVTATGAALYHRSEQVDVRRFPGRVTLPDGAQFDLKLTVTVSGPADG